MAIQKCMSNRIAVSDRSRQSIRNVRIISRLNCRQNDVAYVSLFRQHLLVSICREIVFFGFFVVVVVVVVVVVDGSDGVSISGVRGGRMLCGNWGARTGVMMPAAVSLSICTSGATKIVQVFMKHKRAKNKKILPQVENHII